MYRFPLTDYVVCNNINAIEVSGRHVFQYQLKSLVNMRLHYFKLFHVKQFFSGINCQKKILKDNGLKIKTSEIITKFYSVHKNYHFMSFAYFFLQGIYWPSASREKLR